MVSRRKTGLEMVLTIVLVGAQFFVGLPLVSGGMEAQAQAPVPRVWLAPIQAKQGVAGAGLLAMKFDEVSRTQLKNSSKVEMSDQGMMGPVTAGEADPRIEQAERLRVAGKEALARGDREKALELLRAALQRYEEGLASIAKLEVVVETLGFLGAVSVDLEYMADAKDYFRRVVAMVPEADPLDEYSEKAKAYFVKVRKKLLRKKRGTLRISAVPKGSIIRVDGIVKGKAPLTVRKLVRGSHYVQAQHDDAGLAAQKIRVKSNRTARVKLKLSTDVGPEAPGKADPETVRLLARAVHDNRLDKQFRQQAAMIAKTTKCNYVVVGSIGAEGNTFVLNAFIYGAQEQQVVALDRFKFRPSLASALIQAAQFAKAVIQAAEKFPFEKALAGGVFIKKPVVAPAPAPVAAPVITPVAPSVPSGGQVTAAPKPGSTNPNTAANSSEPPGVSAAKRPAPVPVSVSDETYPRRTRWYKSWWFWGLTGAVVVGGAVAGTYAATQGGEPNDRFDVEVQW